MILNSIFFLFMLAFHCCCSGFLCHLSSICSRPRRFSYSPCTWSPWVWPWRIRLWTWARLWWSWSEHQVWRPTPWIRRIRTSWIRSWSWLRCWTWIWPWTRVWTWCRIWTWSWPRSWTWIWTWIRIWSRITPLR